ncbi:glycosyltransferase family 1 protein [Phocaeicola sp.]
MRILFLVFHGFSEHSGISKKIQHQIKGLKECGHSVSTCSYMINAENHRVRMVENNTIADYGTGKWAAIKKRCSYSCIYHYAKEHHIDLVYVRSFHNANPFTIHLFKRLRKAGIKIVMEIPTYPYDLEYIGFPFITRFSLQIDKLYRKLLAKQLNAIVTYSDEDSIFGQRTIKISNGIDFEALPVKKDNDQKTSVIHLIGVAEVHYWHGYDRLIDGLGKYYQAPHSIEIYFHIVGGIGPSEMYNSKHAPGFHELIAHYHIEKYVVFHNQKFGEELNKLFDNADFAIGSLARHRSHIDKIKTLKNREYAARGIPFIYSETDEDFDKMPYVMKAPADESAIDINRILQFYKRLNSTPKQIRDSIKHLSWKNQMEKVIKEL